MAHFAPIPAQANATLAGARIINGPAYSNTPVGLTVTLVQDPLTNTCRSMFRRFLSESKKYRKVIEKELILPERNTLVVEMSDIEAFSDVLIEAIRLHFFRLYPALCQVVAELTLEISSLNEHMLAGSNLMSSQGLGVLVGAKSGGRNMGAVAQTHLAEKEFLLSFVGTPTLLRLRELSTERLGQLVRIQAQVVRTHPVHPELVLATFVCSDCHSEIRHVRQQFKYTQPTICSNAQCNNRSRFNLDIFRSRFVDFQRVRVQEVQAELPRGNVPRTMEIILRSECVEEAQAGDKCYFDGCLIVVPDVSSISLPGARADLSRALQAAPKSDVGGMKIANTAEIGEGVRGLKSLGARDLNYRMAFFACRVTQITALPTVDVNEVEARMSEIALGDSEQAQIDPEMIVEDVPSIKVLDQYTKAYRMSRHKNLFRNLSSSLFPSIYGCDEIKRGIFLMLLGGVPKRTHEGINLRGDVNICLVGDPSTAKSQFLRQLADFAPRAVYTSGKATSAAGLTAAVVRDEDSAEFVIEAGALMLADNGICCIDEFDKMDPRDQVAIHEAMEQQTISLAKAGVKATLNARTSILAAANPINGRYDRQKSLKQNVNLTAPIMSRFDLFFVLVDISNEVVDYAVAQQIVQSHARAQLTGMAADEPNQRAADQESYLKESRVYSFDDLRTYISVARMFNPKLTKEARTAIIEEYKKLRQKDATSGTNRSYGFRTQYSARGGGSSGRVTVRQLESLIRLSEAVAKLHCVDEVEAKHVRSAIELLSKSLLRVEHPDVMLKRQVGGRESELRSDLGGHSGTEDKPAEASSNDPATPMAPRPTPTPKDNSIRLSYDEYARLGHLLLTKVASVESITRSELISWYLRLVENDIDSTAELERVTETALSLIDRLINVDHLLIVLRTHEDDRSSQRAQSADLIANQLLMIHPSYVPDTEAARIL